MWSLNSRTRRRNSEVDAAQSGSYKIDNDAAISTLAARGGGGIVIQGTSGWFLVAIAASMGGSLSVLQVEAHTLLMGLKLAVEL